MSAKASGSAPAWSSARAIATTWVVFSAICLYAICGHVVQQRGAVHRRVESADTTRSGADERGIAAERLFQRGEVAMDDGLDSGFERENDALPVRRLDQAVSEGQSENRGRAIARRASSRERGGVADFGVGGRISGAI